MDSVEAMKLQSDAWKRIALAWSLEFDGNGWSCSDMYRFIGKS